MRKIILYFAIFFTLSFTFGCGRIPFKRKKIKAGYRGVKVFLYGSRKGVQAQELGIGKYWLTINEEIYTFPTFTQNYVWTKNKQEGSPNDESITFQTIEGLSVGADVGISYCIRANSVVSIFQKYQKGVDEITDIYLRNMVRDAFNLAASVRKVETVYGQGKSELLKEVQETVREQVDEIGIDLERIYFVGDLRLPQSVTLALNQKIEATQRAQQRENELREAKAEAQKRIATAQGERDSMIAKAEGEAQSILLKAKAEAEANELLAKSLTPNLIEYIRANRWNGVTPKITSGTDVWSMIQMSLGDD